VWMLLQERKGRDEHSLAGKCLSDASPLVVWLCLLSVCSPELDIAAPVVCGGENREKHTR